MAGKRLCECGCGSVVSQGRRFVSHHNGRRMTAETKEKIASKLRGRPSPNKGNRYSRKLKAYLSKVQRQRHRRLSALERSRIGKQSAKTRSEFTEKQKAAFSAKLSEAVKHTHQSRSDVEKRRIYGKIATSVKRAWEEMSPKEKAKKSKRLSLSLNKYWHNLTQEEQAEVKRKRAAKKSPNRPESELQSLIRRLGFKFVGNGKLWIDKFNPDFVHGSKPIIVELFGVYWHKNKKRDNERLKAYRRAGYRTVVVWDLDLIEDPQKQVMRIARSLGRCT